MIRAYPGVPGVTPGGSLKLHVSSDARRFRVTFARCGSRIEALSTGDCWFAGEPAPARAAGIAWDWPASEVEIPRTFKPGAYIAVLHGDGGESPVRPEGLAEIDARSARALFVVRDAKPRAPLLVVLPLFTYHAYNVADVDGTRGEGQGDCLYSGSKWVTLHRPGGGVGGHPWDEVNVDRYDTASPRQTFAHWDAKALSWLETHGYEYDCCTDLELHDGSVNLAQYAALASFGHFEYWTREMRARIDAFVAAGGNVAFFGGNTGWFCVRYDHAARAISRVGRWADVPEWKTTGVSYAFGGGKWIGTRPPSGYHATGVRHWAFAGLNVSDGDAFGFEQRLLGYECDGAAPQSDLEILAQGSLDDWSVSDGSGERSPNARATLGVRCNNGMVFTASTVDWARVLHAGEPIVAGITRNVLDRFLDR